jgi:hypothetical protein
MIVVQFKIYSRNLKLHPCGLSPPTFQKSFLEYNGPLIPAPSYASSGFPVSSDSSDTMLYGMLLAAFVLALFTLVSASSYPVEPIKNIVYYAGETVLTTWIDGGSYALLNDMGWITIPPVTDCDVRFH